MRLSPVLLAFCILGCGGSSHSPGGGGAGGGSGSAADMAASGTGGNGGGGGSSAGGGGGTSTDMAGSAPLDLAGSTSGGFLCGTMSCPASTECCVQGTTPSCTTSCSGGFTANCGKPSDCSGGNTCCITAQASLTGGLNITIQNIACMPFDSCVPGVDATSLEVLSRACVTDADCTSDGKGGSNGTQYPDCCTNSGQKVCFKNQAPLPSGWTCP